MTRKKRKIDKPSSTKKQSNMNKSVAKSEPESEPEPVAHDQAIDSSARAHHAFDLHQSGLLHGYDTDLERTPQRASSEIWIEDRTHLNCLYPTIWEIATRYAKSRGWCDLKDAAQRNGGMLLYSLGLYEGSFSAEGCPGILPQPVRWVALLQYLLRGFCFSDSNVLEFQRLGNSYTLIIYSSCTDKKWMYDSPCRQALGLLWLEIYQKNLAQALDPEVWVLKSRVPIWDRNLEQRVQPLWKQPQSWINAQVECYHSYWKVAHLNEAVNPAGYWLWFADTTYFKHIDRRGEMIWISADEKSGRLGHPMLSRVPFASKADLYRYNLPIKAGNSKRHNRKSGRRTDLYKIYNGVMPWHRTIEGVQRLPVSPSNCALSSQNQKAMQPLLSRHSMCSSGVDLEGAEEEIRYHPAPLTSRGEISKVDLPLPAAQTPMFSKLHPAGFSLDCDSVCCDDQYLELIRTNSFLFRQKKKRKTRRKDISTRCHRSSNLEERPAKYERLDEIARLVQELRDAGCNIDPGMEEKGIKPKATAPLRTKSAYSSASMTSDLTETLREEVIESCEEEVPFFSDQVETWAREHEAYAHSHKKNSSSLSQAKMSLSQVWQRHNPGQPVYDFKLSDVVPFVAHLKAEPQLTNAEKKALASAQARLGLDGKGWQTSIQPMTSSHSDLDNEDQSAASSSSNVGAATYSTKDEPFSLGQTSAAEHSSLDNLKFLEVDLSSPVVALAATCSTSNIEEQRSQVNLRHIPSPKENDKETATCKHSASSPCTYSSSERRYRHLNSQEFSKLQPRYKARDPKGLAKFRRDIAPAIYLVQKWWEKQKLGNLKNPSTLGEIEDILDRLYDELQASPCEQESAQMHSTLQDFSEACMWVNEQLFLDLPKTPPDKKQAALTQRISELQQQANRSAQGPSLGFYPSGETQQLGNHTNTSPNGSTHDQVSRALLSRPTLLPEAFLERLLDIEEQYATVASYDTLETIAYLRDQVLRALWIEFNLDRNQQIKARTKWDEITPLTTTKRKKLKREIEKKKEKAKRRR